MRHQDRGWLHCKVAPVVPSEQRLLYLCVTRFAWSVFLPLSAFLLYLLPLSSLTSSWFLLLSFCDFLVLSARQKKTAWDRNEKTIGVWVSLLFTSSKKTIVSFISFSILQNLLMMIPCDFFLGWKMTRSKDIESITANTAGAFSFSSSGPCFRSLLLLLFPLISSEKRSIPYFFWSGTDWGAGDITMHAEGALKAIVIRNWSYGYGRDSLSLFLWVRFPLTLYLFLKIEKREEE